MSQTPETGQPARKRRWFRFHLATILVLLFVGSWLLWANLVYGPSLVGIAFMRHDFLGWPLPFIVDTWDYIIEGRHLLFAATDVVVALSVLSGTGFLTEWLIRRRGSAADGDRRRPLFQFHLSTAVLMVCVAGVMLWASMRERGSPTERQQGWPLVAVVTCASGLYDVEHGQIVRREWYPPELHALAIVLDAEVALAVVLSAAVTSEWLIRRKASGA